MLSLRTCYLLSILLLSFSLHTLKRTHALTISLHTQEPLYGHQSLATSAATLGAALPTHLSVNEQAMDDADDEVRENESKWEKERKRNRKRE